MGREFLLADVGWDGKKYGQFVDLDDDPLPKATKALVFIVAVSVNLPAHLSCVNYNPGQNICDTCYIFEQNSSFKTPSPLPPPYNVVHVPETTIDKSTNTQH